MPINVSAAINSDTSEIISVERGGGAFVDGLWITGPKITFRSLASVQQPSPKQLEILPEGERDKDIRVFISAKPLQTTDDRGDDIADIVTYKGDTFKIIFSGDWASYGHTIAMGVRTQ